MIERALVYIDGSERSQTAAEYGMRLARSWNFSLFGLYIINTQILTELTKNKIFVESERAEYQKELEKDGEKLLRLFEKEAEARNIPVQTFCRRGGITEMIRKFVKEENIDLLLVGELSSIRSRRDDLKDEVERALRVVPCPVLIAKERNSYAETGREA